MSRAHIEQLASISNEFKATEDALSYVFQNWQKDNIHITYKYLMEASNNLEITYFVRLFAEFEGILKTHLTSNYPQFKVGNKPKVDSLIAAVKKNERIKIDPHLQVKLNNVRDFRNSIAHKGIAVQSVTFGDALATLNRFLIKLS